MKIMSVQYIHPWHYVIQMELILWKPVWQAEGENKSMQASDVITNRTILYT